MKGTITVLVLLAMASVCHAASFPCDKAASFVEKAICADAGLSTLDDRLAQAYKKAMADSAGRDAVKARQIAWIAQERNVCKDAACIAQAYTKRLTALESQDVGTAPGQNGSAPAIVPGRCHMNTCWWWKIEKAEVVRSEAKGKLVKVSATTTSAGFSDTMVRKHGYPDDPPKGCKWEDAGEMYLFCSNTLPTYIEFDKDKKQYVGTVPFVDQEGGTAGATEGVGNLYQHVCNKGKAMHFKIGEDAFGTDMALQKPTDIFDR